MGPVHRGWLAGVTALLFLVGCDARESALQVTMPTPSPPKPSGLRVEKTACDGTCVYVRAGALGNGRSWSSALPDLPSGLKRGVTYFVAKGKYPAQHIAGLAGTQRIVIKRATAEDHGTDVGWLPELGLGAAVFGPLELSAPNLTLEGGAYRGFLIRGQYRNRPFDAAINIKEGADGLLVRNVEVDGAFAQAAGRQTAGSCALVSANGVESLVLEGNLMHGAANDGIVASNLVDATLRRNELSGLHGCLGAPGCLGACTDTSGDAIELVNLKGGHIEENLVHLTTRSTTGLAFSTLPEKDERLSEDIDVINNVFYAPNSERVSHLQYAKGLRVVNNTFWGDLRSASGGVVLGDALHDFQMHNNVISSLGSSVVGQWAAGSIDYNRLGVGLGQVPLGTHDVVGEPAPDALICVGDPPSRAKVKRAPLTYASVKSSPR